MNALRSNRLVICMIVIAAAIFLVAAYWMFDPSSHIFPRCPVYALTGLECPGCGSQRALHALLHGDFAAAWNQNAFLLCAVPVIALILFSEFFRDRYPRLNRVLTSPPVVILYVVAIAAWTVLRNVI